jgi:hypothetical protein
MNKTKYVTDTPGEILFDATMGNLKKYKRMICFFESEDENCGNSM